MQVERVGEATPCREEWPRIELCTRHCWGSCAACETEKRSSTRRNCRSQHGLLAVHKAVLVARVY
jgi:hypothetical protein